MSVVHAIRTGSVRIKAAQRQRKPGGLLRAMVEKRWTQWLPIYCWLIESPYGLILVDTGETARTAQPGYLPRWHPYFRTSMQTRVEPEEEVGPQLESMGIDPREISLVIMTHLHTDHAGGLGHFREVPILVSRTELRLARGLLGRLLGYLPGRWPSWFAPQAVRLNEESLGPFEHAARVVPDGSIAIVSTPGHTPGHMSVLVQNDDVCYFLAGDTSYSQQLLLDQRVDGITLRPKTSRDTMQRIRAYGRSRPMIYLPSHDPESEHRLRNRMLCDLRPEVESEEAVDDRVMVESVF